MEARWYQTEAVEAWWNYFQHNTGNPLIAMPTGTGKSVVIAMLLKSIFMAYPGQRVMMLTHVSELIRQNFAKLMLLWPTAPAGIYSAMLDRRDTHFPITFASIQSVYKLAALFGHIDLIFVDEAHLVGGKDSTMYKAFIAELRRVNPKLKITGLSATCHRQGMGMLTDGDVFTSICYDLTTPAAFARLVSEGYLCRLDPMPTRAEINTDDVKSTAADYNAKALAETVDVESKTRAALSEMVPMAQHYGCARWLIFAVSVDHVMHICHILGEMGLESVPVHSKLKAEQREENYNRFKIGLCSIAVSMNALTTGVDIPEIDFIGMLRPTKSAALWVQMLGRGTRPSPATGKRRCLVADFTSNSRRLGPIDMPTLPTRKGVKKRSQGCPVRVCTHCGIYVHISKRRCPNCDADMGAVPDIRQHSDEAPLMALEAPKVERMLVTSLTYRVHKSRKEDRPPCMMITYYCGLRSFNEFAFFEAEPGSIPQRRAHEWWARRYKGAAPWLPETSQEAVDAAKSGMLQRPTHVDVWTNKPGYPEITDHVFA